MARERGEPPPKGLVAEMAKRPGVWTICRPYWDGFWALAAARPLVSTGMGALYGHIPYTEKSQYARDHGFADTMDDLDEFVALVSRMDTEWLKLNQPKPKAGK